MTLLLLKKFCAGFECNIQLLDGISTAPMLMSCSVVLLISSEKAFSYRCLLAEEWQIPNLARCLCEMSKSEDECRYLGPMIDGRKIGLVGNRTSS